MAVTLVTGAAGILGSECVRLLLERSGPDDRVLVLVRDRDPRSRLYAEGLIDRCIELRAELSDAERILAEYQPDAVLHLAAQTQVPTANHSPLSTFESNVAGTWRLLEACRLAARPPARVLVASSDKAYGAGPLPYREDQPLAATAPYDVSKAATDMIARSYASHFGMPVVVTRCANLYGPGDRHTERLVPHCCARLLQGQPPILRSTGRMTREWLFVEDAAEGTLALLDSAAHLSGRAFNLGGGETASVSEVTRALCALASGPQPVLADADPVGEIPHQALDTQAVQDAVGWRARTPLTLGLRKTWEWWKAQATRA